MVDIQIGVIGNGLRGQLARLAHRPEQGVRVTAVSDVRPENLEGAKESVSTMFGDEETVDLGPVTGGHADEDSSLLGDLFGERLVADPLRRAATLVDGIAAVLVGAAANRSLVTGGAVDCATLFDLADVR